MDAVIPLRAADEERSLDLRDLLRRRWLAVERHTRCESRPAPSPRAGVRLGHGPPGVATTVRIVLRTMGAHPAPIWMPDTTMPMRKKRGPSLSAPVAKSVVRALSGIRLWQDDGGHHSGWPPGLAARGGRRPAPPVEHREDEGGTSAHGRRSRALAREGRWMGRRAPRSRRERASRRAVREVGRSGSP